jgi:hypothetical protein
MRLGADEALLLLRNEEKKPNDRELRGPCEDPKSDELIMARITVDLQFWCLWQPLRAFSKSG